MNSSIFSLSRSRRRVVGIGVLIAICFALVGATHTVQAQTGGQGINIDTQCMNDLYNLYGQGGDLNCTANDINLAQATLNILDGCAFPGDTATIELGVNVNLTAQARHDVGIYLATDGDPNGDGAYTGSCRVSTLPYDPDPPFVDLDGTGDNLPGTNDPANAQDLCGDIDADHNPILTDIGTLTVACIDEDGDGRLDIPSCTSWRQPGANDYCDSPEDAFPGAPSKCKCGSLAVDVPVPGKIVVVKETVDDVAGSFDFLLSGGPDGISESFSLSDGQSYDTQAAGIVVLAGTYNVAETVPADWNLESATCDDGSSAGAIDLQPGETVTCTFTNKLLFVADPGISITKSPDSQTIVSGDAANFTILIENIGNVALTNVTVSDPAAPSCDATFATLAVGASETYTCSLANVTADFTNVANVIGTAPDGSTVTDSDNAVVDVINPSIDITKSPDTQQVVSGGTATFNISVTNDGDVDLTDVNVSDPASPDCNTTFASLAVGQTETYTCTLDNVTADFTNIATATGTPPIGPDVTDNDDADVDVINPSIDVTKSPDTQQVVSGGTATFNISVTNDGDVDLTNVNVSDPAAPDCNATFASLAVGQTETYTCTLDNVTADFTNVATATGTPPVGPDVSDNDDADVDVINPSVEIVKSGSLDTAVVDPADVANVGDVINYTFKVNNTGDVALDNVVVADGLPGLSAITCAGTTTNGAAFAGNGTGTLAAGDSVTCSASYTLTQADVDAGQKDNIATATGTPPVGPPVDDDDPETVNIPPAPSIDLTKSASAIDTTVVDPADRADEGDTIDYTFTLLNDGNVTLSNADLLDALVGFDPAVSCGDTSLAPGASTNCGATYILTQADINSGSVTNSAEACADAPDGTEVCDPDGTTTPIPQVPEISIVKDGVLDLGDDGIARPGDIIDYEFTVTNEGNVTLSDVVVSDPLLDSITCNVAVSGASLMLTSGSASVATNGLYLPLLFGIATPGVTTMPVGPSPNDVAAAVPAGIVTAAADSNVIDSLDPGEILSCSGEYAITQVDIDAGERDNLATAEGTPPVGDPVTDDDPELVDIPQVPSIDLTKSASEIDTTVVEPADRADAGDVITYGFTILNDGNVTLSNVELLDALVGFDPAVSCGDASLAPDASATCSATYTLTQADIDNASVSNSAEVCADAPDGSEVCDPDDTTTTIPQEPEISIVKTFADDEVTAGGSGSSFTLVVTNEGNVTLSDALIEDSVNAALTVTNVSGSAGASADSDGNAQTVEWLIASMAPGASATITVDFTVASNVAAGTIPNVATVGADAPPNCVDSATVDCTPEDQDDDTVDVVTDINLSIVKTFSPTEVPQGTAQSFTIEVSNAGPSDAVDVSVTDAVDNSLSVTGVSVTSGDGDCSASSGQDVDCTVQIPADDSVLITVNYVTAPFLQDTSPYGTQSGDDFRFVFVNGSVLEGSTDGGPVYLNGVDITDDVTFVNGLTKNDIIIDPDGPGGDPAFELHLSCSDPFTGGWGQSGGPTEGVDVNWQIAFFSIARYQNGDFRKSCGNVVNPYDVPNTAFATGEDSSGTETVSDDAMVTIEPGIILDKLQTTGKRLTVRLTNYTGEDKVIEGISVEWPNRNGSLTKIRLDEPTVWSGTAAPTSAMLDSGDSGWNGGMLMTGESILRFEFANKSAPSGYTIRVTFTDGTFLDIMQ